VAAGRRRGRAQPRGSPRRGRVRRLLRRPVRLAFRAVLLATLLATLLSVLWVAAYRVLDPPGGFYMASEAWRLGGVERDWRDLDEIAPALARSVIAAEDARFCEHLGFDFEAIRQAIEERERGRFRGASTISQQVAKNVFLWHRPSWVRKGLEAGFTVLIEALWPKRRILEVYLNTAEFGPGLFGAEAAAQRHFGRGAERLSADQAARLAAVLPNPKERSASNPSAFVAKRARAIRAGAATLASEGRDACAL
jgi:monofunctional biosynthetic peptidoglycan transglycosylase